MHLRLFDGRPGSPIIPGVTPRQVAETVKSEGEIAWGTATGRPAAAMITFR